MGKMTAPEWALGALIDYNNEGLTEAEVKSVDRFMLSFGCPILFGDVGEPFFGSNDITDESGMVVVIEYKKITNGTN